LRASTLSTAGSWSSPRAALLPKLALEVFGQAVQLFKGPLNVSPKLLHLLLDLLDAGGNSDHRAPVEVAVDRRPQRYYEEQKHHHADGNGSKNNVAVDVIGHEPRK
jgi:hypothetical protein